MTATHDCGPSAPVSRRHFATLMSATQHDNTGRRRTRPGQRFQRQRTGQGQRQPARASGVSVRVRLLTGQWKGPDAPPSPLPRCHVQSQVQFSAISAHACAVDHGTAAALPQHRDDADCVINRASWDATNRTADANPPVCTTSPRVFGSVTDDATRAARLSHYRVHAHAQACAQPASP